MYDKSRFRDRLTGLIVKFDNYQLHRILLRTFVEYYVNKCETILQNNLLNHLLFLQTANYPNIYS